MKKLSSVILRALGLGLRFALIVTIAKLLEPTELGVYGILAAIASYFVVLVGFEFYNFSSREFIKDEKNRASIIYNQFLVYVVMYAVTLPLLYLFFLRDRIGVGLSLVFLFIIVSEHLAQELNRLLNILGRQVLSSIVLFCRMGLWVIFCIALMMLFPSLRNLEFIIHVWFLGNLFALCLAGVMACRNIDFSVVMFKRNWVLAGLKVSMKFLLGMIFLRALFVLDKVFIEDFFGAEPLGIYVYYFGGAMAIASFVDAAVYVFALPSLLIAFNQGKKSFIAVSRKMVFRGMICSCILAVLAFVFYYICNIFINNSLYSDNMVLGVLLFLAVSIYSASIGFHNILYAASRDSTIALINGFVFIVFIMMCFFFAHQSIYSIALILSCSMAVLLVMKLFFSYKLLRNLSEK